jgi:hypothetical protein
MASPMLQQGSWAQIKEKEEASLTDDF